MLDALLERAKKSDPTRLVTLVTVMGSPQSWMQNCDVICMNRYWGWYVLGGELEKARTMHLEVAAAHDFIAGMQVWNFTDFAAVQSIVRVAGLNHKGVFTRIRTPKLAAHVLRELWTKPQPTRTTDCVE